MTKVSQDYILLDVAAANRSMKRGRPKFVLEVRVGTILQDKNDPLLL